jgi:hypothetical protein
METEGRPKRTAELRAAGLDAERMLKWAEASVLFNLAADAYPQVRPGLSTVDLTELRARARDCARMALAEIESAPSPEAAR